ncbi:hypothetical protein Cgig2_024758 [Carnegiea gigantea]|uniref:Uncharacterized protein n=1 Tax=Carnegiea gigantea TaxID=171969 RepID=A0A9Q1Q916_9CARY|nr:hypothetical protein Cgig2_024758 [Carnegiea gigantea]
MMRALTKPPVQKGHISEVEISDSSNAKEKNSSHEDEEVDHNDNRKDGDEERTIPKAVKDVPKRNKPLLKSEEPVLQQVRAEICEGYELDHIPRWCQFVLDKLISSVRHYKETKETIIKKAVAKLHSAHMEFAKLQAKQQPTKDDSSPLFTPTSVVAHADN